MPIVSTEQPIDSSSAMLRFRWASADGWIEAGQVHVLDPWGIVEHDDPVDVTIGADSDGMAHGLPFALHAVRAVINVMCAWKYPLTAALALPGGLCSLPFQAIVEEIDARFSDLPEGVTLTVHL